MSHNFKLVLFLLLCSACTPHFLYRAANESNLHMASDEPANTRIIFVSERLISNSDEWVRLLNEKSWSKFDRQLKSVKDVSVIVFLEALKLIQKEKYEEALLKLNLLPDNAFDCQVMVLKTDCHYFLKQEETDVRNEYQKSFDCAQSQLNKLIIRNRYRLINYDY